jgi:hypothetical protein
MKERKLMIPEYCKQCIDRSMNPYMSNDFDPNPTPHSLGATPSQMQTGQNTNVQAQAPTGDDNQFTVAPGSPTLLGTEYTQGFLRTIIGKRVKVTFLIGTDSLTDRTGILDEVGISFIVLRDANSNLKTLCDLFAIKFVIILN